MRNKRLILTALAGVFGPAAGALAHQGLQLPGHLHPHPGVGDLLLGAAVGALLYWLLNARRHRG